MTPRMVNLLNTHRSTNPSPNPNLSNCDHHQSRSTLPPQLCHKMVSKQHQRSTSMFQPHRESRHMTLSLYPAHTRVRLRAPASSLRALGVWCQGRHTRPREGWRARLGRRGCSIPPCIRYARVNDRFHFFTSPVFIYHFLLYISERRGHGCGLSIGYLLRLFK